MTKAQQNKIITTLTKKLKMYANNKGNKKSVKLPTVPYKQENDVPSFLISIVQTVPGLKATLCNKCCR